MRKVKWTMIVADLRKNWVACIFLLFLPILVKKSELIGVNSRLADNLPNLPVLTLMTIGLVLAGLYVKYRYLDWI